MFLSNNHELYSCGSNDVGQLAINDMYMAEISKNKFNMYNNQCKKIFNAPVD